MVRLASVRPGDRRPALGLGDDVAAVVADERAAVAAHDRAPTLSQSVAELDRISLQLELRDVVNLGGPAAAVRRAADLDLAASQTSQRQSAGAARQGAKVCCCASRAAKASADGATPPARRLRRIERARQAEVVFTFGRRGVA